MNVPQYAQGPLVQEDGPYYGAQAAAKDASGTSWGAIFAGAAGAAALSLILLILGLGLGLSSVSPWAQAGISAATFGVSTIVWITFTQLAASGIGGYIAGRLRRKWAGVHTDEVYFRDTAHGFLAWSIATLATAALLAGTIGSILGGGVQAGASIAGGAASTAAVAAATGAGGAAATASDPGSAYAVDSLFRRDLSAAQAAGTATMNPVTPDMSAAQSSPAAPTAEVGRIFANGLRSDAALPPEDVKYVGQLVAQRTGLSQPDAEKRVADTFNKVQAKAREVQVKAKEAADQARKTSAYAALWLFISLLLGAFVASLFATFGGRHRDL
ncbi:hypothetical protein [Polaromonas sp. YR568]|uniref:hypothetical protein n=1 Tax=Polaromonas sp. YR568 TaxID=1855301 RepID=UPI00398BF529